MHKTKQNYHHRMAEEIAQSRKELFGDEPEHQESQSSQSAEVKQVGNAMSETKDIMNKNVEMVCVPRLARGHVSQKKTKKGGSPTG